MTSSTQTGPDGEVFRTAFPDLKEADRSPTMVSYGLAFDQACKKHIDGFISAKRVFILVSGSLASKTEHLHTLETALGEKHVGTWIGVPPHSPYDGIIPILHRVKSLQADCIVVLGGGSLSDAAKLIIYAAENGVETVQDLINLEDSFRYMTEETLNGFGNPAKISLVFNPTTLSGAEYSKWAGCTNPVNRMKCQFTHPSMYAKLIILDPSLSETTPRAIWCSTGVRAIDHCVENILSTNPREEVEIADRRGLLRLIRALLAYVRDPHDRDAHLEASLGCIDSLTGLILMVLAGASHGIGHNLGPLAGCGHGETSCVLLPAVLKYNARVNGAKQDSIRAALWSDEQIATVLSEAGINETDGLGDCLRAVFNELGMPSSLKAVGLKREQWDALAENSLADHFLPVNPVPITTAEQVKEILELCSGD